MRTIFSTLIPTSLLLAVTAHAQMDPSTAWLVRRPTASPSEYDQRREVVKPTPNIVITPAPAPAPVVETPVPRPRVVAPRSPESETREPAAEENLDTDETLRVRFSAGYFDLNSHSAFAPRDYRGGGPVAGLGLSFWATPTFGLRADYVSTFAAHVRDGRAGFALDHQEFDGAAVYRRAYGTTGWEFGLGYRQVSNALVRADRSPFGTRSRGLSLNVGFTRAATTTYAHRLELHLQPVVNHVETGGPEGVAAGGSDTSFAAGLVLGGAYTPSHDNAYFWRLRYSFERNAFAGRRSVDVGQALVTFGMSWGS